MRRPKYLKVRQTVAVLALLFSCGAQAYPEVPPYLHTSTASHDIQVVNDGLTAFEVRLEMIERAQTSIDFMVYLFQNDDSSRLTLHRLMDKAVSGVRVRLLLDYFCGAGHPDLSEDIVAFVQSELKRRHAKGSFEVRYYNRGTILGSLGKVNHRMHAKMMVVDGREILIGGRNIGDDYFSMIQGGFDYIDRELWARGPIAQTGSQAFFGYWKNTDWVSEAKPAAITDHARAFVSKSDGLLRDQIHRVAKIPSVHHVSHITLAIDQPGHKRKDRIVTPVINHILRKTDRYLMVENYSLPMSDARFKILEGVSAKNVPMLFLTNSFESHDSAGVSAYSQKTESQLLRLPQTWIWGYRGHAMPDALKLSDRKPPTTFSTHTKSLVSFSANRWTTLVGSHNFDVRSEQTNNEVALIVDDVDLAKETARDIMDRITQSHPLATDGEKIYYTDTGEAETRDFSGIKKTMDRLGLGKLWRSLY